MLDWWKSLREYLKVQVDTEVRDAVQQDTPVTVKFTITNSAPPVASDFPEIVFENVLLTVKVPPKSQVVKQLGTLAPGQSAVCEHGLSYIELIEMEYDIQGTASPDMFLRVRRSAKIPDGSVELPLGAYIQVLDEASIYKWLDSAIRSFPVPGPNTTLAQLEELRRSLDSAVQEIHTARGRLQRLAGLVQRGQSRDAALEHSRRVTTYLENTMRGIQQMKEALSGADLRSVLSMKEHVIDRLEREAADLQRATERLKLGAR